MKQYEIERKFLLRPCLPGRFLRRRGIEYRKYFIQQYYLPEQNGKYIRYRRRDSHYFQTVKSGEGLVREEYEKRVSKKEYRHHLKDHIGKIIEKNRYVFDYRGVRYEWDKFLGALKGLSYLEIEFESRADGEQFVLPEIFSPLYPVDVTDDNRFSNSAICRSDYIPTLSHTESVVKGAGFEPFGDIGLAIASTLQELATELEDSRKSLLNFEDNPEILHAFRVASRKSISILDAFKAYLLPAWYKIHRRNISQLLSMTNSRRDIDVLLEKLPLYHSHTKDGEKGLLVLGRLLAKRKEVFHSTIADLPHNAMLRYEISTLASPHFYQGTAKQPAVIAAIDILRSRLNKIIKMGRELNGSSQEREYHKLRIQFKKLRYFIEAMKPLARQNRYDKVLKSIKKMQTILGNFHDCQVQQSLLLTLGGEQEFKKAKVKKTIRILINTIEKQKRAEEKQLRKKFDKFAKRADELKHLFEVY